MFIVHSQPGYSRKRQTLYVVPMNADQLGLIVFLAVVWLPCADGSVGGGGDDCGRAESGQGGGREGRDGKVEGEKEERREAVPVRPLLTSTKSFTQSVCVCNDCRNVGCFATCIRSGHTGEEERLTPRPCRTASPSTTHSSPRSRCPVVPLRV